MKKIARKIVASILGYQVRMLFKKNNFKVIGVVGSIGKTSTKLAIAKVLESDFRVRYEEGNYNDLVTVPLIFFGRQLPSLYNPFAWGRTFLQNARHLRKPYPYDIVVVELGSDSPGQIYEFHKYLSLEIAVITAITPEHMQTFKSLDAVADEELSVERFASLLMFNKDLIDNKYAIDKDNKLSFGKAKADYNLDDFDIDPSLPIAQQFSRLAAAAVASKLGMSKSLIVEKLNQITAFQGRMQILKGVLGSTIIDDSYNSSPDAVKLALDYLYSLNSPQKIAVLGSMNEMGGYSAAAHKEVGEYCDSNKLDLVITIGNEAKRYLAPAAEKQGCSVSSFDDPYTAGDYLKSVINKGSAVLVKGSQNGVFAEETVKILLAEKEDASKLVRQSPDWLKIKQKAFNK